MGRLEPWASTNTHLRVTPIAEFVESHENIVAMGVPAMKCIRCGQKQMQQPMQVQKKMQAKRAMQTKSANGVKNEASHANDASKQQTPMRAKQRVKRQMQAVQTMQANTMQAMQKQRSKWWSGGARPSSHSLTQTRQEMRAKQTMQDKKNTSRAPSTRCEGSKR